MADKSLTPIDLPELSSAPASPASGFHRFYAKTDGKPYSKSSAGTEYDLTTGVSLTTTGTSGAATLVGTTLNIPVYQSALTNPVTGTGTAGQVTYFSGTSAVTGSADLTWNDTTKRLGLGTASPYATLTVGSTPASSLQSATARIASTYENGNLDLSFITSSDTFGHRTNFNPIRSRGTLTSPSAVQSEDFLFSFLVGGFDGSLVQNSAGLIYYAEGSVSGGNVPIRMSFLTGSSAAGRTERMRITSTGNVLINNTDGTGRLTVRGSGTTSATTALLVQNSTPTELFKVADNGDSNFGTGMYYDAVNKRLGLGTASPYATLTVGSTPASSLQSATARIASTYENGNLDLSFITSSDTFGHRTNFNPIRSRGTLTSPSAVQSEDFLFSFLVGGFDGSLVQNSAGLIYYAEGSVSGGNVPIRMSFLTGSSAAGRTERMRITSTGNVLINNTDGTGRLTVRGSGTTSATNGLLVEDSGGTDNFTIRDDGGFAFRGGTVGVAQTGYTTFTNLTTDRTCNANATTVEELADILGTLIEDLKTKGIISA